MHSYYAYMVASLREIIDQGEVHPADTVAFLLAYMDRKLALVRAHDKPDHGNLSRGDCPLCQSKLRTKRREVD